MMKTPWFEKDVRQIGTNLAVGAGTANTSIVNLGLQPGANESGPFAGTMLHYTFTQSGGASDSDLTIVTYLSYDGTTVDDEPIAMTWTTDGATSGSSHEYTRMILAAEPNIYSNTEHYPPAGVAFRQTLSRADGDRDLVVNVYSRRFWWR